ncbi:MAG: glycerol kinase GlpK [Alphaproteobacteria bacterium]|nr:glycerol kinase GlpK [Alphaproteobacteria bacterium]
MPVARHILAIDQGTTSTRAMVFDSQGRILASASRELPQIFPRPGWVEHDAERIFADSVAVARDAIEQAGRVESIAGLGLANQRETSVLWQRATGRPIANAIVWQDRRTAELCAQWRARGLEPLAQDRTGLLLDPYFSASKIAWLLAQVDGVAAAAARGALAFGSIDSWLIWRLTGGKAHRTDATNAARTLLFDLGRQAWDADLAGAFGVPLSLLPEVLDNSGRFGTTLPELFGRSLPILGSAGDQQAAAFGQACFAPGEVKSTYGTGCFVLLNTGERVVASRNRLIATLAYRLAGKPVYALEGSIFAAGAAVQWLRDGLKLIASAADSQALAAGRNNTAGVYLVPAFAGLGAPYWDAEARGAILGLTRATGIGEIVRATLEAVAYQTRDLLEAMADDMGEWPRALRVDGGMAGNDWLMQFLADMVDLPVDRPALTETTALGAARLAGMAAGLQGGPAELHASWQGERRFTPSMPPTEREALYAGWRAAVARVRTRS